MELRNIKNMKILGWLRSMRKKQEKSVVEETKKVYREEPKETPIIFHRLTQEGNVYYTNAKAPYNKDGTLKKQTIERVFDFAYTMAFTTKGEHRSTRSGGEHSRRNGEIFANTFQGKIAESAAGCCPRKSRL